MILLGILQNNWSLKSKYRLNSEFLDTLNTRTILLSLYFFFPWVLLVLFSGISVCCNTDERWQKWILEYCGMKSTTEGRRELFRDAQISVSVKILSCESCNWVWVVPSAASLHFCFPGCKIGRTWIFFVGNLRFTLCVGHPEFFSSITVDLDHC